MGENSEKGKVLQSPGGNESLTRDRSMISSNRNVITMTGWLVVWEKSGKKQEQEKPPIQISKNKT